MRGERRSSLTAREREVLGLVRVGLTNEEIASRLGISPDTAKFHVSQILAKLGVTTREEAAVLATPEDRGRWHRLGGLALAAKAGLLIATLATVTGVGALAWGVAYTGSGDSGDVLVPTTSPAATPSPLAPLPVPWLDSTPAPQPSAALIATTDPSVLAVPECRGDQLDGEYSGSVVEGPYTFSDFVIANTSSDSCRLSNEPSPFEYLDADGQKLMEGTQAECTPGLCAQYIAVLEPNGTLPSSTDDQDNPRSRALFRIRGFNPVPNTCDGSNAVQSIVLGIPGGGMLTISTAAVNRCMGTFVGLFVPEVQGGRPPTAPPTTLITAAQIPSKTTAGQEMKFTVEVTNVSDTPFSFGDTCPNYVLAIGKGVNDTHSLNCHAVSEIAPGDHILFAMKVMIPAGLQLGNYDASWTLDAPYASPDAPSYPLAVIAP